MLPLLAKIYVRYRPFTKRKRGSEGFGRVYSSDHLQNWIRLVQSALGVISGETRKTRQQHEEVLRYLQQAFEDNA